MATKKNKKSEKKEIKETDLKKSCTKCFGTGSFFNGKIMENCDHIDILARIHDIDDIYPIIDDNFHDEDEYQFGYE